MELYYVLYSKQGSNSITKISISCTWVLSCFSLVRLFSNPRTVAHQVPLSVGFSRQEYWSGLLCPPPRDFPDPGIELMSLMSPALAGRFFTASATWRPPALGRGCVNFFFSAAKPLTVVQGLNVFLWAQQRHFNIQAEGQGSLRQVIMCAYSL